jgi:GWxTD domain-containing protein
VQEEVMRNVKGFLYVILLFILLMNCGVKREIKFEQGKDTLYEAVRLIMTGPEKKIFKKLPSEESKEEFMKEFWKKRDPDLSTEENEFKKEFENRLAYANLRFKSEGIPGWKTDRGRIYMYLGPPDQVYEQPYLNYSNLKGYLVWVYYKYRLGVEFMDRTGTNKYDLKIDSTYSFRLMDAIDRAKFGLIYSVEAEMEKNPGQIEVDFDNEKREIVVRIPSSSLFYKEENGYLVVDLRFDFYIYSKNGIKKDRFSEMMNFKESEEEVLKMDKIIFTIPYQSKPGSYYVDVKISDSGGIGQFRKIAKIKIKKS